ncbi:MAG: HdeA/HdeB family chaperone, partial [Stellaceae bacterium]
MRLCCRIIGVQSGRLRSADRAAATGGNAACRGCASAGSRPTTPGAAGHVRGADRTGRWEIERVRCADLLGAAEDDRAAAAMFYYGYLAAKAGIHVIDVNQIEGNIHKVMDQCAASPNITVPQAFRQAL